MSDSIYPDLNNGDINKAIDIKLSENRKKLMQQNIDDFIKDLTRYKKLKNRYNKFDISFQIIGITFGILTLTGGAILTFGTSVPATIVGIISAIGVLQTTVGGVFSIAFLKRKKKCFAKKCEILKCSIDKLYLFYDKSKTDRIISMQEYEEYLNLVNAINNDLLAINNVEHLLTKSEIKKLRLQAKNEVKESVKEQKLEQFKSQIPTAPPLYL